MHFGLSIPPFTDVATLMAMAHATEDAGWDGVFLWDHLQWDQGFGLDIHDPWVLLGAMAAATTRVDGVDHPPGWDLVVSPAPDFAVDEYTALGVTWLITSTWPEPGWPDELLARVHRGPPDS